MKNEETNEEVSEKKKVKPVKSNNIKYQLEKIEYLMKKLAYAVSKIKKEMPK